MTKRPTKPRLVAAQQMYWVGKLGGASINRAIIPKADAQTTGKLTVQLKLTDPPIAHDVRSSGSKANMFQGNMNGFVFCDDSDV
eukprot:57298-Pelagomonas_calceolata.AAC.1